MKNIFVRIAVVALFAAGTLSPLSAEPKQDPHKPQSPIPICWQCGRGGYSGN